MEPFLVQEWFAGNKENVNPSLGSPAKNRGGPAAIPLITNLAQQPRISLMDVLAEHLSPSCESPHKKRRCILQSTAATTTFASRQRTTAGPPGELDLDCTVMDCSGAPADHTNAADVHAPTAVLVWPQSVTDREASEAAETIYLGYLAWSGRRLRRLLALGEQLEQQPGKMQEARRHANFVVKGLYSAAVRIDPVSGARRVPGPDAEHMPRVAYKASCFLLAFRLGAPPTNPCPLLEGLSAGSPADKLRQAPLLSRPPSCRSSHDL